MKFCKLLLQLLLVVSLTSSCNSDDDASEISDQCLETFLDQYDMRAYNDEDLQCHSYITLFELNGEYFTVLDNRCADLLPFHLINCSGEEICIYTVEEGCFELVQEARRIGIIGISK